MKKLTFEEFSARTKEISKAKRIFNNLTGNNISLSFAMYQEILAEERMEVFISTAVSGNRSATVIDEYERPKCPECNTELRLKVNPLDAEGRPWNTAWVCVECQAEFYSEKTVPEWMEELKKKEG